MVKENMGRKCRLMSKMEGRGEESGMSIFKSILIILNLGLLSLVIWMSSYVLLLLWGSKY